MEVKSIYLDLQKAERKKNWKKSVWVLESEAFKDPLELQIGYEDKKLDEFKSTCEALDKKINDQNREIEKLKDYDLWLEEWLDLHLQSLLDKEKRLQEQEKKIENQTSEISSLYKTIADLKTTVETLSGTIIHLQEWMKLINQKLAKQPMVYSDKTFISGRERTGLWVLEMPCGEYVVIGKYVVGEHNEYVENQNNILFEKITVDNNYYVPYYQLIGWTGLDTPTATIYWDLVFIPC